MNNTFLTNQNTGKDDWQTPKDLFLALDAIFHFTLDPCSTHENALCAKHYTKEDDGLSQNWGGGDCIYESSLLQRDRKMDRKGVSGKRKWRDGCLSDSCQTGHALLARDHFPLRSKHPVFPQAAPFQWSKESRWISLCSCRIQQMQSGTL